MAHCDEYLELISASLDGALSPTQQEKLNAHLAACAECQRLYDGLSSLRAAMADLPPVEVPAGLKDRIMDAVAAEAEHTKVLPFVPKKRKSSPIHWQRWLASAAVLAVVVMGTWSWKPWESTADRPRSAESATTGLGSSVPDNGSASAGTADAAAPAEAQPAAVPEPASAPPDTTLAAEGADAPAEKNAVRSAKEAPSSGGTVYGYDPGAQTADASTAENVPGGQASPAEFTDISSLQAPAEAPAPQGAVMPRLFSAPVPQSVPSPSGEGIPEQSVTSQAEAVNVLANYIYEFVDTVEPVADSPDVYVISSPTGVSGTVTCLGEFEPAFLLDYQESLSTEVFHYSVSRSGEVFLLGQEALSEPTF